MAELARGVGRAFQAALTQEGPGEDLEVEGPSLANARRRLVFRYLCLRPCARIGDLAHVLSLSHATVRWHQRNLLENGYLEMDSVHFFPRGLIDPDDATMFGLLATPSRAEVLVASNDEPGIALLELAGRVKLTRQSASKIATELSESGLVALVEDGRFRRLYPTGLLQKKREANRARLDAFCDHLLRRLAEDGLTPELLRRDESTLLVRFGAGPKRVVLDLPLDPYLTAWMMKP